jgi:hypothetical protein
MKLPNAEGEIPDHGSDHVDTTTASASTNVDGGESGDLGTEEVGSKGWVFNLQVFASELRNLSQRKDKSTKPYCASSSSSCAGRRFRRGRRR